MKQRLRPMIGSAGIIVMVTLVVFTTTVGWAATPDMTFKDVHRLLKANDLTALNDRLTDFSDFAKESQGSARPLLDLLHAATSSDQEIDAAIESWADAFPTSCHALTALGLQRVHIRDLRMGPAAATDMHADEADKALDPFRAAIEADQRCTIAYAGAARSSIERDRARAVVRTGLEANPASVLLTIQGWAIDSREAMLAWDELDGWVAGLEALEESVSAITALRREIDIIAATQLAREQRLVEAALRFAAALEGSDEPAYRIARARFYEDLDWLQDARRELLPIFEVNADHRDAHLVAFRLALLLEHRSAALAHAEQVLRHDPRHPDVLILKARMLALAGDESGAAEVIEAALDLGGKRADIAGEAGAIAMQYDLDRAGPLLARALEAMPDDPIVVVDDALAKCMPTRCVLAVVLSNLADRCYRSRRCDATVVQAVRDAMSMQEADASAAIDRLQSILDQLL
ncbi:MAG: hypothetical protein AAFO01_17660 [Pseudomonadota bacterium]